MALLSVPLMPMLNNFLKKNEVKFYQFIKISAQFEINSQLCDP